MKDNLPIENFLKTLFSISIWSVAKIFVCFALSLYVLFSIVVIRQVNLMTQAFNDPLAPSIKLIAWIHFFASVFILLVAIFLL